MHPVGRFARNCWRILPVQSCNGAPGRKPGSRKKPSKVHLTHRETKHPGSFLGCLVDRHAASKTQLRQVLNA